EPTHHALVPKRIPGVARVIRIPLGHQCMRRALPRLEVSTSLGPPPREGWQLVAAHTDSELAAVMVVMAEDVPDDLVPRDRAKDLALCLGQTSWRHKEVSKVSDGLGGKRALDHAPCGLKSRHQLRWRTRGLPLTIPVCEGQQV